ncbi:MAG: DUF1569 domain-containing protein [Bacteroidia bacterium]
MQLVFSPINASEILHHINNDCKPLWGKMSAQHMVEHLAIVLKISIGKIILSLEEPTEKTERIKQLFLISDKPFQKNFVNPITKENLLPLQFSEMEESKKDLQNAIQDFINYYEQHAEHKHQHPVFGMLNKKEWYIFHEKHFTHHFSQFALI